MLRGTSSETEANTPVAFRIQDAISSSSYNRQAQASVEIRWLPYGRDERCCGPAGKAFCRFCPCQFHEQAGEGSLSQVCISFGRLKSDLQARRGWFPFKSRRGSRS